MRCLFDVGGTGVGEFFMDRVSSMGVNVSRGGMDVSTQNRTFVRLPNVLTMGFGRAASRV